MISRLPRQSDVIFSVQNLNLGQKDPQRFDECNGGLACLVADEEASGLKSLPRLIVHVSNDCNLVCKYCYAQGGHYGLPIGIMSRTVAADVIASLFSYYDCIEHIQFFGGEPLLNMEAITYLCHEITRIQTKTENKAGTTFGLVTNGTLIDDQFIELCREYDLSVTISLDGPKDIHDFLRGEGTFVQISESIYRIQSETDAPLSIECAYTPHHLERQIDLISLIEYFYGEIGCDSIHIHPVALRDLPHCLSFYNSLVPQFREAAIWSVQQLQKGVKKTTYQIEKIVHAVLQQKVIPSYCSCISSTLAVTHLGEVFPCSMLVNNMDFSLGNVTEFKFPGGQYRTVYDRLGTIEKDRVESCRSCWARPLCFGCFGADYYSSGCITQKTYCDLTKAIIDGIMTSLQHRCLVN